MILKVAKDAATALMNDAEAKAALWNFAKEQTKEAAGSFFGGISGWVKDKTGNIFDNVNVGEMTERLKAATTEKLGELMENMDGILNYF
jgi:hypothetical protein